MDLLKVGKFIAERRKKKNLTQLQLAERLHVTDRAISKWECGRSMPDSSIMLELCEVLEISVNELLTGEELEMKNYNEQAENNLLEITKQKEEADKRLLLMEIVAGLCGTIFLLTTVILAAYVELETWLKVVLIVSGFIVFILVCFFCLKAEQKAGYYECQKCGHRYVPKYSQVVGAMHFGRTRFMKCPHCGKRSWNKKVISQK